jgi:TolB protein
MSAHHAFRALARQVPLAAALAALAALAMPRALAAQQPEGVRIGLTYAAGTRPGVYVLPMTGRYADSTRAIVIRDLDFGDRVSVIAPDSGAIPSGSLNYPLYAALGAAAILQLSEQVNGGVRAVLHEVGAARVMNTKDFPVEAQPLSAEWRMALHAISDEIERWVTGAAGTAATRVLFNRGGTLWMVDSDGANPHPITGVGNGSHPAWHPNGRSIAYMEMADDGTHILVRDLVARTTRRASFAVGSNFTPAFAPDGRTLVFSSGSDGTDLWSVPLNGGEGPVRITVGRGSETASPSFSPDGRRIAFTSGRLGRPEIYITDADGANPQWLTTTGFGDQSYRSDPSWAPDGRHVAFQTQIEGRFQIATINLRDRSVKQHTIEGSNEQPSWAPDARHLVFTSSRSGTRQLWVLDTESGRLRQLTFGSAARMGAWSPRLAVPR